MRAILLPLPDGDFALPVDVVREVAAAPPVTALPGAPRAVLGVFNLRGEVCRCWTPWRRWTASRAARRRTRSFDGDQGGEGELKEPFDTLLGAYDDEVQVYHPGDRTPAAAAYGHERPCRTASTRNVPQPRKRGRGMA